MESPGRITAFLSTATRRLSERSFLSALHMLLINVLSQFGAPVLLVAAVAENKLTAETATKTHTQMPASGRRSQTRQQNTMRKGQRSHIKPPRVPAHIHPHGICIHPLPNRQFCLISGHQTQCQAVCADSGRNEQSSSHQSFASGHLLLVSKPDLTRDGIGCASIHRVQNFFGNLFLLLWDFFFRVGCACAGTRIPTKNTLSGGFFLGKH